MHRWAGEDAPRVTFRSQVTKVRKSGWYLPRHPPPHTHKHTHTHVEQTIRWAGEDAPRVTFRSQVTKVRNRVGGVTTRVCVGDWGAGAKGWEFSRHATR